MATKTSSKKTTQFLDGNKMQNSNQPQQKSKKKNKSKKIIGKTLGNFKCTSESCGKAWSSVHAWTSERFFCEICSSKAKVVRFVDDEECSLDCYNCDGCGESWQSLVDPGTMEQECFCGRMVVKNAEPQKRKGRHYFFKCINKPECGIEWEDFYQGTIYRQRCTKCGSAGEMGGVSQVNINNNGRTNTRRGIGGIFKGSSHDIEGCDMCQALLTQGIARSCTRKHRVVVSVEDDKDGGFVERILEAT